MRVSSNSLVEQWKAPDMEERYEGSVTGLCH